MLAAYMYGERKPPKGSRAQQRRTTGAAMQQRKGRGTHSVFSEAGAMLPIVSGSVPTRFLAASALRAVRAGASQRPARACRGRWWTRERNSPVRARTAASERQAGGRAQLEDGPLRRGGCRRAGRRAGDAEERAVVGGDAGRGLVPGDGAGAGGGGIRPVGSAEGGVEVAQRIARRVGLGADERRGRAGGGHQQQRRDERRGARGASGRHWSLEESTRRARERAVGSEREGA
jgi:hypothetical protein